MTQGVEREALTQYRGGLKRLLVGQRQTVHARQHEALDRRRNVFVAMLLHVAQQLLEEQWIALGALDTAQGELAGHVEEGTCQFEGVFHA